MHFLSIPKGHDAKVRQLRFEKAAEAALTLMRRFNGPVVAEPLQTWPIEQLFPELPTHWFDHHRRALLRRATTLTVGITSGWDTCPHVTEDITQAKKLLIPIYRLELDTGRFSQFSEAEVDKHLRKRQLTEEMEAVNQ